MISYAEGVEARIQPRPLERVRWQRRLFPFQNVVGVDALMPMPSTSVLSLLGSGDWSDSAGTMFDFCKSDSGLQLHNS